MATQNLTRKNGNHKKRDVSVAHFKMDSRPLPDGNVPVSADVYEFVSIPPRSVIVGMAINIITPNDAGITAAVDIGIDGDDTLAAAFDMKGAAGVTNTLEGIYLPTGGILTAIPTYSGALTEGLMEVSVSYIEVDKTTGQLTAFSET